MTKEYYTQAYKTGSDIWTHIPYIQKIPPLLEDLKTDDIILNLGSGRGLLDFYLAERGYKVIGLDFVKDIIEKNNNNVLLQKLEDKLRFIEGDALNTPFEDESFNCLIDIGLFHHLKESDWDKYISEVYRILTPNGIYINSSYSSHTTSLLNYHPDTNHSSHIEKYGLQYHFFTEKDITKIFTQKNFTLISQTLEYFEDHNIKSESLATILSKFKKS